MRSAVSLAAILLSSFAGLAQTGASSFALPPVAGSAAVMVIEDGGLDAATVRTVRSLTAASLRQRGVQVLDDRRFEGVKLPDDSTRQALRELGVTKIYALQMGRLGQKVILTLQELSGQRLDVAYSASMAVEAVEETDKVLPLLAEAVLDRRAPTDTGAGTPVGSIEPARPKKGRPMGFAGLTFGFISSDTKSYSKPFGINGAFSYEVGHWRMDAIGLAESHGSGSAGFLGLGGTFIPLEGDISPTLSLALGYSALGGSSGSLSGAGTTGDGSVSGIGFLAGVGVEFLRTYRLRAGVAMHLLIPLYDTTPAHTSLPVSPLVLMRLGF